MICKLKYNSVTAGRFIERPNRFIAIVEVEGKSEVCHVKNTGRCRELLVPEAEVYLEKSGNTNRKTKYDLIAVRKGDRLINMDSQAPNRAAFEYLSAVICGLRQIKSEQRFENSRFDFYAETDKDRWFIEVKGVTLEKDGAVFFPDAPTERGIKHIKELIECRRRGYRAMILFVIQMENVLYFSPNYDTQPEFGEALKKAAEFGVEIEAVDCTVTPDEILCRKRVEIRL